MPRINTSPSDDFYEAVQQYKEQNDLRSLSEALLQLAAVGLYIKTGERPPEYAQAWGGDWRREFEGNFEGIEIDRLNVLLGGWPPLADDD